MSLSGQDLTLLTLDPANQISFYKMPQGDLPALTSHLKLANTSSGHVAFKWMTSAPAAYHAKPFLGRIGPGEVAEVSVTMKDEYAYADQVSKHRFKVQAIPVECSTNVTQETFKQTTSDEVQEGKLRVILEERHSG